MKYGENHELVVTVKTMRKIEGTIKSKKNAYVFEPNRTLGIFGPPQLSALGKLANPWQRGLLVQ